MTTVAAPNFIIHAAGSLGNRPEADKRPYRLKFSVVGYPNMPLEALRVGLSRSLTEVERQMRQRGFVFAGEHTIQFVRKQPHIEPMTVRLYRPPSAKQMLASGLMQGNRFRAPVETLAMTMPLLHQTEAWEYIFSAIFVHDTILVETPSEGEQR